MFQVRIEDRGEARLIGLSHKGSYTTISKASGTVLEAFAKQNLWPHVLHMTDMYFDDPTITEEENLHSFSGFSVADGIKAPDDLEEAKTRSGRYAVLTFKGPYPEMAAAQEYLMGEWLPVSGEAVREAPLLKIYLNDPREVAPHELLTEICLPLE